MKTAVGMIVNAKLFEYYKESNVYFLKSSTFPCQNEDAYN